MMTTLPDKPIAVAMGGEDDAALAFAVDEALRTGGGLRLIHAVDQAAAPPMSLLLSYQDAEEVGNRLLSDGARVVEDATDRVTVQKVVHRGGAVQVLIQESEQARLVVLQHRGLSRVQRIFTGSISTAVAARAHCPVVSVPEHWRSDEHGRHVVVGLDEAGEPLTALRVAFEEAQRRAAPLVVAHAWCLSSLYEEFPADGFENEWRKQAGRLLREALDQATPGFPQVKVTTELRYQAPADALSALAQDAALLILGRRSRRGPLRIGSLARALLRAGECPVMVVPVGASGPSDDE